MNIFDCINIIKKEAQDVLSNSIKSERIYNELDFEKLLNAAEKGFKLISKLMLSQRNLLLSMYEAIPSLPRNVNTIEANSLNINVEALKDFSYPVYKLSLPYLLPNKRERKTMLKSAFTDAVINAVRIFCSENNIVPFEHATIIFVSSYEDERLNIDNDNKESVVIQNGLIGRFIRDDRASVCNTIYYSNRIGKGAKTEVYIMDEENDIEVYSSIKNNR